MAQSYYLAGIGLYLGFISWVFVNSLRASRGKSGGIAYEAVGARRFAAPLIAILVAEAMLGPADALSLTQNGAKYGAAWAMFPLGAALAQAVAGLFFVQKIHERFQGRISIGDIFAEYSGEGARITVGLIVFAQAVAFAGVLVLAGGQVLESLAHVPLIWGMILTATVVGLYTSIGGITAVVNTNKLQAIFAWSLVLMAGVSTVYIMRKFSPDLSVVFERPDFAAEHPPKIAIGLFIAYFMGELLLPAYSVRALIAKDGRSARLGFLLASLLLIVWYLVITTAGSLSAFVPAEYRGSTQEAVILDMVRAWVTPNTVIWHLLGAMVAAALLALIHSTLNAFLNSGAVALARDVVGVAVRGDRAQGTVERWAVIVISVLGVLVALSGDTIIGLLIIGYTIWVPTLLGPFARIVLWPHLRLSQPLFWCSVISGAIAWGLFEYVVMSPLPGILVGFLANISVLGFGTALGREKLHEAPK